MDINSKKIILHNLTFRGIEAVPGVLDFDQRGLVYMNNGDVCITKTPVEASYLAYLENLGWKFNECRFINPASQTQLTHNSIFYNPKIISAINQSKHYLDTYNATREEKFFSKKVRVPIYAHSGLSEKFGTKSGFRKLAKKLNLPIPAGFEKIRTPAELEMAIKKLSELEKKEIAIKIDEGISGAGITKISAAEFQSYNKKEKKRFLKNSLFKLKQAQEGSGATAEEWVPEVIASPSIQIQVFPDKSWKIVSMHDQLLEGKEQWYVGCKFPQTTLRGEPLKKVLKDVRKFTRYLISKNFNGFFGIDLILTKNHKWYWVEANMRKTGTFYPRIIVEKINNGLLKGISYIASDFTVTKFKGMPFSTLKEKFRELLYPINGKKEGIILYNVGALKDAGRFDVVCIGKNNATAKTIYSDLKKKIESNNK